MLLCIVYSKRDKSLAASDFYHEVRKELYFVGSWRFVALNMGVFRSTRMSPASLCMQARGRMSAPPTSDVTGCHYLSLLSVPCQAESNEHTRFNSFNTLAAVKEMTHKSSSTCACVVFVIGMEDKLALCLLENHFLSDLSILH